MRISRILSFVIFILLLCVNFIFFEPVLGEDVENLVQADFDIEMVTATDFTISVIMTANRLTIERAYTYNEIINADEGDIGAFRLLLFQMLESQINDIFVNAEISDFNRPIFDGSAFNEEFNISLKPEFFNLNETVNAYEIINGILDMGGYITYNLDLQTYLGWNNTYTFYLSEKMFWNYTNAETYLDDQLSWDVNNWNGESQTKSAVFSIYYPDPTSPQQKEQDIFLEFSLNTRDIISTALTANIIARYINIKEYEILPDCISNLKYVPADGIRLFEKNGLITWDNYVYKKSLKNIEQLIISTIETSEFNQTLDMFFDWDKETTSECTNPYEINNMDSNPPIKAVLSDDDVNLKFYDISSTALFGLVKAGGTAKVSKQDINFGGGLIETSYPYNITILLPLGIKLDGDNVYTWNVTIEFSGNMTAENAPKYSGEDIHTVIELEVQNTDLNLLSLFTGKAEISFAFSLKQTRNYNITRLPQPFKLPDKIDIDYLNSDALRLCIQENIFNEQDVDDFLTAEKEEFKEHILRILPGISFNGNINKQIFDQSVEQEDNLLYEMNADDPVQTSSYAHSSFPIRLDLSVVPPKFRIPTQRYNLTGIKNQTVTYRIIFPEGVDIDAYDYLQKTKVLKNNNGKQYIEVTFTPSESELTINVNCSITPTAIFLIFLFTPCIISIIITLILLIVILIIRRKRRKGKPSIPPKPEQEYPSYEEEDYYIPPPPNSKK